MKHDYTEGELFKAIIYASENESLRIVTDNGDTVISYGAVYSLQRILQALPDREHADDWQECKFEDIRKGDRVKRSENRLFYTNSQEGAALRKNEYGDWFITPLGHILKEDDTNEDITLYRIPAPVVPPDPEEHPLIIVKNYETSTDFFKEITACWRASERYPERWAYRALDGMYTLHLDKITEWEPAKVVVEEDA